MAPGRRSKHRPVFCTFDKLRAHTSPSPTASAVFSTPFSRTRPSASLRARTRRAGVGPDATVSCQLRRMRAAAPSLGRALRVSPGNVPRRSRLPRCHRPQL